MKPSFKILGLCLLPVLAMTGCGSSSVNLGQNVTVNLDPTTEVANVQIELGTGLQVSLAGNFMVPQSWGNIYFVPPTQTTGEAIGISLNLANMIGQQFKFSTLTTLPGGSPLPVSLTGSLFEVPVMSNSTFNLDAAFSLTPNLQVAAVIGISQFSSQYVVGGIALCQNFQNASNVYYASLCLFGPSGTQSGGIFIGGNFGNVIPNLTTTPAVASASSATVSSQQTMVLEKRSEVFQLANTSSLHLAAVNVSSNKFAESIYDPKNMMSTPAAAKSLRNVEKYFKVRN